MAVVTFKVDSVHKGAVPSATIDVVMFGSPEPDPDWSSGTLSYAENAPLLLPGDRAILMLERDSAGRLSPEIFVGEYGLNADGTIEPNDFNPFGRTVHGMSLASFLSIVDASVMTSGLPTGP